MARQGRSRNGMPRKDQGGPAPEMERRAPAGQAAAAGQAPARGTGMNPKDGDSSSERPRAGEEKGMPASPGSPASQDYRGEGPGKVGLTSDQQPDLVAPSGVNQHDHGAADDKPRAGGALNFDDGTDMVHPRGKVTSAGRTWNEKNPSDAGKLGPPGPGMSDRNGPSDPDAKRNR